MEEAHREEEGCCNKQKPEKTNLNSSSTTTRKGKSCKGTLYYSSNLKSKGKSPRCVGFTRSLPQVPSYIVSESQVEASKEGRSLTDFKYACVGYSVHLDNMDRHPTDDQNTRAELPVCVGIELLVDKRPADHQAPAHAHGREDNRGLPQSQPQRTTPRMGEDFLLRFSRNAGLVASGVAKNMSKVGNYIKESVDDILYRRPK